MKNTFIKTRAAKLSAKTSKALPKLVLSFLVVFAAVTSLGFISPGAVLASSVNLVPTGIGNKDEWTANTGTKTDAVASNDGDTTYIISSSTPQSQTFSFPGAALPAGSVVTSVTLTALVEKDGTFLPSVKLIAENGGNSADDGGFGHQISSGSSYATITWDMTNNPITGLPWTLAEVNAWTTNFGVSNAGLFGAARATQIFLTVNSNPPPVANPTLPAHTCGLDIALVLDNSGSINGDLPTMKTAFNSFTNSLIPGTPTDFSVTYFSNTAHYALQTFSSSASSVTSAISSVPTASGQTNWEDGLIKAQATFDPRPGASHPNVIIFASDGDPNRYGPNGSLGVGGTVDPNALAAAISEANSVKQAGTRILTLGIGASVNQANLEAISSNDAYYSVSDINQLTSTLQSIAGQMCGGTVTITKKLDTDGDLATTNDQTSGGAGWAFDVNPGFTGQTTDASGQTSSVAVTAGTYTVQETNIPAGVTFLGATCSGATNNGSTTSTSVSGLQIGSNDIVSCVFYNKPKTAVASGSDVSILKSADKSSANIGDAVNYSLVVTNHGPDSATGVTITDILPAGVNFVSSTSTVGTYNAITGLWNIGTLSNGASATTTIATTIKTGTGGSIINNTATASSTSIDLNTANNSSSASFNVNNAGGGGAAGADLSLSKTVNNAAPNQGDTIIYTLVVKNSGPDAATGVAATDTLPSAVTFVNSTSTQGSYSATTSLWTIGNLANGASATTTITVTVNTGTAGQSIANSAVVGAVTVDPNLSNNSSSASASVASPSSGSGGGTPSGGTPSGGGSSGGGGIPVPPATSSGQVLGTSTPSLSMPATQPIPQILGESTSLPRTGSSFGVIILLSLAAVALVNKKLKLV